MANIVVIDKNVFQGSPLDMLCEFAEHQTLVISYPLCVECLVAASRGRGDLLDRIHKVVRAGGCCGAQPLKLVESEKVSRSPVQSIVDRSATEMIANGTPPDDPEYIAMEAEKYQHDLGPIVEGMLQLGETHYGSIVEKGYLSGMRATDMEDRSTRLRLWVEATDKMAQKLLETSAPDMASYLTPEWYTWQDHRLRWVLAFEWAYQKAKSGSLPPYRYASHDFHDMQYVTYLTRADALITRDERLVAPLARAAFPQKCLSSDLGSVTRPA